MEAFFLSKKASAAAIDEYMDTIELNGIFETMLDLVDGSVRTINPDFAATLPVAEWNSLIPSMLDVW